jgi:hypothetical protein
VLVPLVHELFLLVNSVIEKKQSETINSIAETLHLLEDGNEAHNKQMREMLHSKLKNVFQEQNQRIFAFEGDEIIKNLINDEYKPLAIDLISEDLMDDFEDNIGSDDFITLVRTIIDLNLHMILNDPPITIKLMSKKERQ